MIDDNKCSHSTISSGAVTAAADAVDKAARENLPVLRQGEEVLVVELPVLKDCSNCRWGDLSLHGSMHLCWGFEAIEAEICRHNDYSSWEPKRNKPEVA